MLRFTAASIQERGALLRELKRNFRQQQGPSYLSKRDRKGLRKVYRRELVKRSHITRIVAAWLITVPASAFIAAALLFMIRGMLLS
jgi:PiT family inorganic phosphate transporter